MSHIILAIEYLHSKKIIYRDLKPSNLILDMEGYLNLIDFGSAKILNQDKTYTLMGTINYVAPEVLNGSGHSFEADLFSIGILSI